MLKKIRLYICVAFSLAALVNASVWEGAGAQSGALPERGLFIATNSFPINTVVHLTNLENGKTVPVVVASGLESSGFLALLSRDAADAIGLPSGSLGRIRMNESKDIPLSSFTGSGLYAGAGSEISENENLESAGSESTVSATPGDESASSAEAMPDDPPLNDADRGFTDVELSMVPTETRPPETNLLLNPGDFIAAEEKAREDASGGPLIDPSKLIDPVPSYTAASRAPGVSPPKITYFEPGKYYLQIGSYLKEDYAVEEASKLDRSLPTALMEHKDSRFEGPMYRVLIGPVNLGESEALLAKYREIYKDAFVWTGQ